MIGQINDYARTLCRGKSFECNPWSATIAYYNNDLRQDFVTYNNILYRCIKDVDKNVVPGTAAAADYWEVCITSVEGAQGEKGDKGDIGDVYFAVFNIDPSTGMLSYSYEIDMAGKNFDIDLDPASDHYGYLRFVLE